MYKAYAVSKKDLSMGVLPVDAQGISFASFQEFCADTKLMTRHTINHTTVKSIFQSGTAHFP